MGRVEEMYLSKGSFPNASEEYEVEKVDIGIEVDDLGGTIWKRNARKEGREAT